jgi:hypothetical protein
VSVLVHLGFFLFFLVRATHFLRTLRPVACCVNAKLTRADSLRSKLNVVPTGSLCLAENTASALPSSHLLADCLTAVIMGAMCVNLLADPWDVASMVEGIRLARRLARTAPLASLHHGEVFPGDAVGDDADALTRVLKAGVGPYNHANGTVRMGPRSDPQAVVDASGAVRAVAGLSVADASIMPTPPSNVTALTTMAIAEKVARDLRTQLYAARAAVPTVATDAA